LLDGVLLRVVRGGAVPTAPNGTPQFESLLADKYGTATLSGTATGFTTSGTSPAVLTGTLTLSSPVRPSDLNGRLVSFVEPGRPVSTHRIIRAGTAGVANTAVTVVALAIDASSRSGPFVGPKVATRAIVNGREFDGTSGNEPWDGFDADNAYLAQVGPGSTISSSTVSRLSYLPSFNAATLTGTFDPDSDLIPDAADNDNDGVYDGLFMNFGIPDARDANGNKVDVRASVLIVDLDGRFNVNAHGSLTPIVYGTGHSGWTAASIAVTTGSLAFVPLGSGYGPAEIAANLGQGNTPKTPITVTSGTPRMFDGVDLVATTGTIENPRLLLLSGARADSGTSPPKMYGKRVTGSRYSSSEVTLRLRPSEGRYGEQSPRGWLSEGSVLSGAGFDYARPGRPDFADGPGTSVARRADPRQSAIVNYGVPAVWWNATGTFNAAGFGPLNPASSGTIPPPRGVFNSPPDLHGRMKTLTVSATASGSNALTPHLIFAQPEWSSASDPREIKDNPYEFRLDTRRGLGGYLKDPSTDGQRISTSGSFADNPFTPAELEPVLRPYDIDTNRCAPRLVALLGSAVEDSRLKLTTDSWDTTAIVGGPAGAAGRLFTWLQNVTNGQLYGSDAVSGIIGGEVARGERFDLNRSLAAFGPANAGYNPAADYFVQRQAYFKDLYTLLVALEQGGGAAPSSARAAELAQWAANVVEFRDADSRITPFEYDTNPRNGWTVDGNAGSTTGDSERAVVWGVERPEILIRETFAWDYGSGADEGGMAVVLHRPWNAVALAASGTIAGEPCDYAFDTLCSATNLNMVTGAAGIPGNLVDLGKKAGPNAITPNANAGYEDLSAGTYPIWRLRIVTAGSSSYVRFDAPASAVSGTSPTMFAPQTLASGNDKPKLPVDGTLAIHSGSTVGTMTVKVTTTSGSLATATMNVSGSPSLVGTNFRVQHGEATATLYLERLSDPSRQPTEEQWKSDPLANLSSGTNTLRYVVVDSCTVNNTATSPPGQSVPSQRRSATAPATALWRNQANDFVLGATLSATTVTADIPTAIPAAERDNVAWFPWPNRPFVSATELFLVPRADSRDLLSNYQVITEATASGRTIPLSTNLTADRLFDAVHVPTRFAGIHVSGSGATLTSAGIWPTTTTVNQLSSFREPGRVNLNTVTSRDVWNTVVGGPLSSVAEAFPSPVLTTPAQTLARLLGLGGGTVPIPDTATSVAILNRDKNSLHRFYTATRLANTVTPRSNVFAIWITLRESVGNDPDSVRYRRAFYVVDRSIPVAFEEGRDTNVWDCVRVRSIIE
jgi:hypothetical protein